MIDILLDVSKVGIKSIFTAEKYVDGVLDEDLTRILFIRNYLEESVQFVEEHHKEIDTDLYLSTLKQYALDL